MSGWLDTRTLRETKRVRATVKFLLEETLLKHETLHNNAVKTMSTILDTNDRDWDLLLLFMIIPTVPDLQQVVHEHERDTGLVPKFMDRLGTRITKLWDSVDETFKTQPRQIDITSSWKRYELGVLLRLFVMETVEDWFGLGGVPVSR